MGIGFSAYSGSQFLLWYGALLVAGFVASIFIPSMMRSDGRTARPDGHEQFAYLNGGTSRFSESVLARLFAQRKLQIRKKRLVAAGAQQGDSDAERALLVEYGELSWRRARQMLAHHAAQIDGTLVQQGLLMQRGDRTVVRLVAVLPLVTALLIGLFRWQAGRAEGEPTGFLVILMLACAGMIFWRFKAIEPQTRAGVEAIREARDEAARLRSAPRQDEVALAVALFGTGVLIGTPFAPLHDLRSTAAGTGGDSSGCGDGGCGGGGCGGCGG